MKKAFMIGAAGLQILVLAYMAAEREWIVRAGQTVFLRTMPVDPRDPFRGDYVRLDYEINHVPTNMLQGEWSDLRAVRKGTRIYTGLIQKPGGIVGLGKVTRTAPDQGLFIRGRSDRFYSGGTFPVTYGIEAYFVEQKKGKLLEEGRLRGDVQVPLEMEVAIGASGTAVLKGYRWCPLGIGLRLENTTNRLLRTATVVLTNVSTNELAIVNRPDLGSFSLEVDQFRNWTQSEWTWVGAEPAQPATDDQVVVLKPGQIHEVRVDFASPAWFVKKPGTPSRSLSGLDWNAMFRLVYRSPSPEECRRLKQGALIWQGELMSRAFGGGRID